MLPNNNGNVIRRMAGRSLKSNRRRSLILLFAVVLSAFLLFTVFTVGITYFKMQKVQNLRLNGGVYDAILYGLTEEQQELCEKDPNILYTGTVVVCGVIEETQNDRTPDVGLVWADDSYWEHIKKPAVTRMEGSYPVLEKEVLVTEDALKACGLDGLQVGDTFTMQYGDFNGSHTQEFRISGMWEGYGDTDNFFMSKSFFDQSGWSMYDKAAARYHIDFKQKYMTQKEQDDFIERMHLEKQQNLFFLSDYSHSIEILLGLTGVAVITCFCAYLLIYNILYLAVSGNVRYYGLLQTVGMTGRQLYRLMHRQIFLLAFIGMTAGLLLGGVSSFFLLPAVVKALGIRDAKVLVEFRPAVFFLTILLVSLTIYLGSRKSVRMAVSVSPVEALGYRSQSGRKKVRKRGRTPIVFRMAAEQLTRDKKKTGIVLLSLSMSLCVFLCLMTMLKSQGARTLVGNYGNLDLVVKNDTLKMEDKAQWTEILDEELLKQMEETKGVKTLHTVKTAEIIIPWEADFAELWMQNFYDMWMYVPYEQDKQEYREHPENFGTFLVGIDEAEFDALNQQMEENVDKERFMDGETCMVYRSGLDLQNSDVRGKSVTCAQYDRTENEETFEIAGLTDESYYTAALSGTLPTLIVSEQALREFASNVYTYKAGIQYEEEFDAETEEALLALQDESPYFKDFSCDSKIEELKTVEKAQGNLMGVGMGLVLILALIGILNYVNTVTGSIQSRQKELAILESIGMTERQVRRMLVTEGLLFAGGSLLLAGMLGIPVTYGLYQTMNYNRIPFAVPIVPAAVMALIVVSVCVLVPLLMQRAITGKEAMVERIRGGE